MLKQAWCKNLEQLVNGSFPDWALLCKHVAAVLYGIGARFDENPLLFFELRGIDAGRFIWCALMIEDCEVNMKNKKWKQFRKLIEKCYDNLIGADEDGNCWVQAFELLMEIVREERRANPNYASELEMLAEVLDYEYDIEGWLEDCLDEMDMREEQETLLKMCDTLLDMFGWPEYTGSDIKLKKASTMALLGHKKESVKFCEKWLQEEPENIVAAAAGVYAYIEVRDFDGAEKLVERFIEDKSKCTDENDIMFMAASTLYQVTGKKKEKKVIDKAMKEYEKFLKDYFEAFGLEDEDEEFFDGELPFS